MGRQEWIASACLMLGAPSFGASPADRAIELYDDGRYAEARPVLEGLDREGRMTGPLLYRLHFCQSRDGERERSRSTLERALDALEHDHARTPSLDSAFYLVNTYASLGRQDDARRVAAEAGQKLRSAAWPAPAEGMPAFQAGRIHQIEERPDDAARQFTAALRSFAATPGRYAGATLFASRFLGARAMSRGDHAEAETHLGTVARAPGASASDWRDLAVARARRGNWAGASEAWKQSVRLDPVEADDPRYAARLADAAAALGALPAASPGGAPWNRLFREDLERLMQEQADAVAAARASAAAAPPPPAARRKELEAAVRLARPLFVAAGLEYAMRGMPIRETAFGKGYAVLIFQDAAWELPPPASAPQN